MKLPAREKGLGNGEVTQTQKLQEWHSWSATIGCAWAPIGVLKATGAWDDGTEHAILAYLLGSWNWLTGVSTEGRRSSFAD